MSLEFGAPRNQRISYFIQHAVVRGIQATYENEFFGIVWDIDLSILLDVTKKNGEIYTYTMNIRANYSRNNQDDIIGWGSAFKIARMFERLNIEGKLNEDGTVPEACLEEVIGREIYVLFYRTGIKESGDSKFQAWDIVDIDRSSILAEFDQSQQKGYPRNFLPATLKGLYKTVTDDDGNSVGVLNDQQEEETDNPF